MSDLREIAKAYYRAYERHDRSFMEENLAADFTFTSPFDDHIDRAAYFERCWPNSEAMEGFEAIHGCEAGERAFLIYEARVTSGKRFRNCEVYTARDGQLTSVEVYFGWNLPHEAPPGGFVDPTD
jgi:ketosteroid isomerase-like protein